MRLARVAGCAVMLSRLGLVPGPLFFLFIALAPAAAQQVDLNAIQRRFNQFYDAGNYPAALEEAKKLEAGAKARLGTADPNYSIAIFDLALAYEALGKYAEAEQHYKQALVIDEKLFGPGNRKLVRTINNLAIVNMYQGKYARRRGALQAGAGDSDERTRRSRTRTWDSASTISA